MRSGATTSGKGDGPLFDGPNGGEPPRYGETLAAARERVQKSLDEGIVCPCCDQYARVYQRQIYRRMALWLIWAVKENEREPRWLGVEECPRAARGGDTAKLRYWGLIIEQDHDPADRYKRTSGLWKPTESGRQFAYDRIRVPKYCAVYNGEPLDFSSETASIRDALGREFNYDELMRGQGF